MFKIEFELYTSQNIAVGSCDVMSVASISDSSHPLIDVCAADVTACIDLPVRAGSSASVQLHFDMAHLVHAVSVRASVGDPAVTLYNPGSAQWTGFDSKHSVRR